MATTSASSTPLSSRLFDAAVLGSGLLIWAFIALKVGLADDTRASSWFYLLSIPVIVLLARFPLLLDRGHSGIEIGFDSSVLMFLLCTLPPSEALSIWSLAVVVSQLTTERRASAKRFNIGVGILGGAVATLMISGLRGDVVGTPRELLAVSFGAACYFVTDFVLSGISLALEDRTPIRQELVKPGIAVAVASFVAFDSLGYLGAVVVRSAPWWTAALLAVPLVTLLVATQAVTRGHENARRLSVLFDAAVRTQTQQSTASVFDALAESAANLLRLPQVEVRTAEPMTDEVGALVRDGDQERWIVAPARIRARSTVDADRKALETMAAVASDAFIRVRLTDDMTHLARHDVLTGLPNRALLLDRVEQALKLSRRQGRRVALLFCDLDGFKQINDRFGHSAGDAVLIEIADRLIACVRESDTVARLGGDEFAILLEGVNTGEIDSACNRILTVLRQGIIIDGHHLPLSTSIGVALQESGQTAAQLLLHADMAMYEAKALGKNQRVSYQGALGQARVERLELVESLRAAISARELTLVYQSVVRLDTGEIDGLEALARWSPGGTPISPDVFIPVAEESGLIVDLGNLVLDLAAAASVQLDAAAGRHLTMGVNVSPQQLRTPGFEAKIDETLARMDGTQLVLELTERDLIINDVEGRAMMQRLTDKGISFALDDFGVGYSSIGYLKDLPIHIIKADASLSAEIDQNERSCGLLGSIMTMGKALDMTVVVEGLERPSQIDHLRNHAGGNFGQGYLLHRPMPLEEMLEVVREKRESVRALPSERKPLATAAFTGLRAV